MAGQNLLLKYFNNGPKSANSKDLEMLLKVLSLTNAGVDVGAEISADASGNFIFGSKQLKTTATPSVGSDLVNKDYADTKIASSEKGANNGVAPLDAGGKIAASYLPSTLMEYKGTYNPNTNTPSLVNGGAHDVGDVYRISVAGSRDFNAGAISFEVGDWVMYNGTIWEKSDNSDAVTSVNGQQGIVVLNTDHIAEGAVNFYYTASRFNASFAAKTTTDLTEGTNLYFTTGRFDTAFAGKTTSNLTEGTNLYHTAPRAIQAVTEETLTNNEGVAVTARQFGMRVNGQFKLVRADDAINLASSFYVVKDATVNDAASGVFYKRGARIPGFTGLTVDTPVYLSKTTDGGYTQTFPTLVAGDKAVLLGVAISATELEFNPEFLFEVA